MPDHPKPITVCGRLHLGPVLVNGGPRHNTPVCKACGQFVTKQERDQIQRTWDTVHMILRQYKNKEGRR